MGMTDAHKAKTELRWIDLTLIVRVNAWTALRMKKEKGSEARRMKRAIAALNVDDELLDKLAELQVLERATSTIPGGASTDQIKTQLKEHKAAKVKVREMSAIESRLCVSMENLKIYKKHIAGDDELSGAQIDEFGNFFDEIENAEAADPKGAYARYLFEDGKAPPAVEAKTETADASPPS